MFQKSKSAKNRLSLSGQCTYQFRIVFTKVKGHYGSFRVISGHTRTILGSFSAHSRFKKVILGWREFKFGQSRVRQPTWTATVHGLISFLTLRTHCHCGMWLLSCEKTNSSPAWDRPVCCFWSNFYLYSRFHRRKFTKSLKSVKRLLTKVQQFSTWLLNVNFQKERNYDYEYSVDNNSSTVPIEDKEQSWTGIPGPCTWTNFPDFQILK